jgi:phosphate ABC transporter substrate-binding protein, PhoT family (TC 3.A.1.7.1)
VEKNKLLQYPAAIGAVVVTYNVPELGKTVLNMDAKAVCDIYMGKITKWNDPYLQQLNPNVKLPDRPIVVVHRSDGSGTTWIFTNWLAKVCPEWNEKVGFGTSVKWPTGVGAKGNEGVTNYVKRSQGRFRICGIHLRQAKQPTRCKDKEQGRKLCGAERKNHARGCKKRQVG